MPFSVLTQDEAKVIKMIFYEDMKTTEVAAVMGIHWQRAHKIQLNAIIKMRARMLGLSPEPEQYDENIEVSNERWSDILLIFLIKFF